MLGLVPEDVALLAAASDPRLSPDSTRVGFTVSTADVEKNRYDARLWVAQADGSGAAEQVTPDDVVAGLGRWSPDGQLFAYTARPVDDDETPYQLRVIPADGGEHTVVTTSREAMRE